MTLAVNSWPLTSSLHLFGMLSRELHQYINNCYNCFAHCAQLMFSVLSRFSARLELTIQNEKARSLLSEAAGLQAGVSLRFRKFPSPHRRSPRLAWPCWHSVP